MKWTWLILFGFTIVIGLIVLKGCPKKTEVSEEKPSPNPISQRALQVPVLTQEAPSPANQLQGNGPLSAIDNGAPKAPTPDPNAYGGTPNSPPPNGYNPTPNFPGQPYAQPPAFQPPTFNEPGFDPNAVPPPPPPPPPSMDGDFDGNNMPPPAFDNQEEFGNPSFTQPYEPEEQQ